jgi:hypothetical protein
VNPYHAKPENPDMSPKAIKLNRIRKHPATRTALFLAVIVITTIAADKVSHWQSMRLAGVGAGAAIARGFETVCDIVCDRLFGYN